jgi:hypothetical protein
MLLLLLSAAAGRDKAGVDGWLLCCCCTAEVIIMWLRRYIKNHNSDSELTAFAKFSKEITHFALLGVEITIAF